jgi:hypothetical protein
MCLVAVADSMRAARDDRRYIAITITATTDDEVVTDTVTEWAGPHPDHNGWELRRARIVARTLFEMAHGRGNYLVVEGLADPCCDQRAA